MPYMIDQYVKSTSEKMVDKMALAKEMADKWLIKPSLAKKMVDILVFMVWPTNRMSQQKTSFPWFYRHHCQALYAPTYRVRLS